MPRQLKFLSNRWSDSLFKFDRIILSECRTIFMKNLKKMAKQQKAIELFFQFYYYLLPVFFICFCLLFMFLFLFVFLYLFFSCFLKKAGIH